MQRQDGMGGTRRDEESRDAVMAAVRSLRMVLCSIWQTSIGRIKKTSKKAFASSTLFNSFILTECNFQPNSYSATLIVIPSQYRALDLGIKGGTTTPTFLTYNDYNVLLNPDSTLRFVRFVQARGASMGKLPVIRV